MLYTITYEVGIINSLLKYKYYGRQNYEIIINGKRFIDSEGRSGYKSVAGAKASMNNYLKYNYTQIFKMSDDEYKAMMKELMGTTPDKLIYIRKIDD